MTTVGSLVEIGKSKLTKIKLSDSRSLLKRTLLRVSLKSWKSQLEQSGGTVLAMRHRSRVRQDKFGRKSRNRMSLHNPELLIVFDYLESLYDSDFYSDDDFLASSNSSPYIYRGTYTNLSTY